MAYIGRFAPSPTGPLHFGSLVAAVSSYLQARSQHGKWLLRMEDLDPPREPPGAAKQIVQTLEQYGFEWDGPVYYQSQQHHRYQEALSQLQAKKAVYPCACGRRELSAQSRRGNYGLLYPGTCRQGLAPGRQGRSWRVRTADYSLLMVDLWQGVLRQNVQREVGDFIVQRADGLIAYQLAVVVDDAEQGVSEVVRGCDLLGSTPRQLYLQTLLGLATPDYCHLPVVIDARGDKLSKQTGATGLPTVGKRQNLMQALTFLAQKPEPALAYASLDELWAWAICHWHPERLHGLQAQALLPKT